MVSAALWLALVDNTHRSELVTGAGIACLAATAAVLVRRERRDGLRFRAAWLVRLWRPLALYPRDLWQLVKALPGRGGGRFSSIPQTAEDRDALQAGRRVLTQWSGSFAPNTYVIGTDAEHDLLLVHQLVPGDASADSDPLGLS
jgi:hypothetical protein